MRNLTTLILSLVLVVAVNAVAASVASAETTLLAYWLTDGAEFSGSLTSEDGGKFLLEDTSFGLTVACTGTIVGSVSGAEGEDTATEVLNASKVKTGTPLSGTALECEKRAGCENTAKVWPLNLPWKSLLYLLEGGNYWDQAIGEGVGYEIECNVLLTKTSEECKSGSSGAGGVVLNVTSGVETTEEALLPLANCTLGGTGAGADVALKGNLITVAGETLSVSSEC
jgi:hypothetical protein